MNSHTSKTPPSERCEDYFKYTQWNQINWKSVYRTANRLQTRIAKAAEIGDWSDIQTKLPSFAAARQGCTWLELDESKDSRPVLRRLRHEAELWIA